LSSSGFFHISSSPNFSPEDIVYSFGVETKNEALLLFVADWNNCIQILDRISKKTL